MRAPAEGMLGAATRVRATRGAVVAEQGDAHIKVSVTAPGRVGASRLAVECTRCGAAEQRYVPRGTVSVEHACGGGWQVMPQEVPAATG